MANVLDCEIDISEFEFQSNKYVYFRTNSLINPLIPPSYGLNSTTTVLLPDIGIMVRMFAIGPGDLGSIPGRVIPKTLKMVLDASLLYTQHYKVRIKGKGEKSRESSNALPYTLV